MREALEILHRIKPYAYRTTPSNRPAGILGSSIHQAKRVFAFLFLSTSSAAVNASSEPRTSSLREPLATAVALLEDAVTVHNDDAVFTLAEMSFFGKYGYPRDYARSAHLYEALAVRTGNATAQHRTGFMFATGIGGVKEKDQAKALLYHTFAADGGSIHSQMTVAFRHHAGISTPRDCERATAYYKKVADRAIAYVKDGPPGGKHVTKEAFHLADEEGGVYGEGASSSSAGLNAKQAGPTSDAGAAFDDVLEYLDLMSRKGEVKATFGLGRLHYDGSRALKQDYHAAKNYFLDVARRYWTKEGKIKEDTETSVDRYAAKAAGYLGCMFLRGEGMEQNFQKARVWFKRGIDNGDALCEYSMGLMHLHGLGVNKDPVKAAEYFASAADQDFASAQVRLGVLLMDQGDLASALRYFEFATRHGHIEAFYYLAEISNQGIGRERSCSTACLYYKMVAEKAEPLHSMFLEANDAYEAGDVDMALLGYMLAAEQGYEVAQANVAYLLDRPQHRPLFSFITRRASSILHDSALALVYWTRSARQANIDSMVKMGDYYLYGTGTDLDREKAAACYTAAAETLQSAQAMWNLGWMHENGIGIVQDFHLAKRFYDQSLETNREAYLPVSLALLKLRARSAWNTFTHGKINSIHDDPSKFSKILPASCTVRPTLLIAPSVLQSPRSATPLANGSSTSSKPTRSATPGLRMPMSGTRLRGVSLAPTATFTTRLTSLTTVSAKYSSFSGLRPHWRCLSTSGSGNSMANVGRLQLRQKGEKGACFPRRRIPSLQIGLLVAWAIDDPFPPHTEGEQPSQDTMLLP